MRRIFIVFGFAVFALYCWASVVYQNQVDVPDYVLATVDLRGGASAADWAADGQGQFQTLMELEGRGYQLPDGADVAGPGGEAIPPERALTADDFEWLIGQAPPDGQAEMTLRDPAPLRALLARGYVLRDAVPEPGNPDGPPLYAGGTPLDKDMLDNLRLRGLSIITVSGHGAPVSFQPGTALMIALIFLTLVAALKPVIWTPFLHMLERRKAELAAGDEAARRNQAAAAAYDAERQRLAAGLDSESRSLALRGRGDAARAAGEILAAARAREKEVKLAGLERLRGEAERAEAGLREDVPALAEAIAAALTPGGGGAVGTGKAATATGKGA